MASSSANHGGSSTCVIELQEQPYEPTSSSPSIKLQRPEKAHSLTIQNAPSRRSSSAFRPSQDGELSRREQSLRSSQNDNAVEASSPPTNANEKLQQWNNPRINIFRSLACFFSMFVMGANDAAYGALLVYMEEYYHLTYIVISLVFLSPLVGYTASALLNNVVHLKLGQRGVAFLGPLAHAIAYVIIAIHPPYPVLVVTFMLAGFGNGIQDAGWNAWMGAMANANEVLGVLHGFYSLGATLSPLLATSMVVSAKLPWYQFYYVMIGASALELALCLWSFWSADAAEFRAANPKTSDSSDSRLWEALIRRPSARVTWLCSLFLLGYVGTEVGLGGWITTFMIRVRDGDAFASGMTATGFWLGMAVGRVFLGFITPRIGEKLAISIYLPICMALELLFWLVPSFLLSAIAVAFQGFFLGPMFPSVVVVATRLLPRHLHVSAIGFAAAFGGGGAALFPFAVGAIAQAKGVAVLQPIVLAMLAVSWLLWLALPRLGKKRE
ncbi:major facilitator superfamily domain-containing protein [Phyllosticta citricarpa]|uniref:Major facilitator superfamily domain-containing protein n=2 Tax=Phyllosticta TaxID=121621 RepID=A0ABR1MIT0_9PEZI